MTKVYLASEEDLRQVLENLWDNSHKAAETIRAILAQKPLEPAAYMDTKLNLPVMDKFDEKDTPLYTLKEPHHG